MGKSQDPQNLRRDYDHQCDHLPTSSKNTIISPRLTEIPPQIPRKILLSVHIHSRNMDSNAALKLPRFTYTGNRLVGAHRHAKQNIRAQLPTLFVSFLLSKEDSD